ncbi:putative S-layer protein [uncultured Eubacteriales bacterium]|uniref:Putative S-layer protein n=1 Tax=uncultured Eubacteriales bacterium TaxID=172733 RepID=A0A212IZ47_9FIRM|nr:putative S-layer protein [uncultured Eubacteriales bacterium]
MKRFPRIASCVLCLALMCGIAGLPAAAAVFSDAEGHWAQQALADAADNGLLRGADGKLMPNGLLTRSELAAIMARAVQATATADLSQVSDVPAGAWYASDMAKAVQMEILQGSGGMLRPTDPITRQETFTVLARALALTGGDADTLSRFADSSAVADWARSSMTALVDAGLVVGGDAGLRPQDTITRAEFVTVMQRAIDCYIAAKDGAVITEVSGTNVMLTGQDLHLKDVVIVGDLYIGDGVNAGTVTLENVTVKGRLVVRGGSALSLKGTSSVSGDTVLLSAGPAVNVASGSSLGLVVVNSNSATLSGSGTVKAVTANGDNCAVSIPGTVVTAASGATGTTAGTIAVSGGSTVTVPKGSTSTGGSGGSDGGTTVPAIQLYTYNEVDSQFKNTGAQGTVKQFLAFLADPAYGTDNDSAISALTLSNSTTFVNKDFTLEPSIFPSLRNVSASYMTADRTRLYLAYKTGGMDCVNMSTGAVIKSYTAEELSAGAPLLLVYDESAKFVYLVTEDGVTKIKAS